MPYGAVAGIRTQMGSSPTPYQPEYAYRRREFESLPGYHYTVDRSTFKLSFSDEERDGVCAPRQ